MIDPLGGIWTLWPLFGTANQMLAAIALTVCTVVLFKMKREQFAWVTIVPATRLVACTMAAGLQKVFSSDPNVGFVSHAHSRGANRSRARLKGPGSRCRQAHPIAKKSFVVPRMRGSSPKIFDRIVGITALKVFSDQTLEQVALSFVRWIDVVMGSTQHDVLYLSPVIVASTGLWAKA